jgi:Tfp pilus assembly protein PilX
MPTTAYKKGYLLFIVLTTIIIVALFASILLNIIMSQARLTKHITSRVQAYYAALGAFYYANDRLRVNDPVWTPVNVTFNFCRVAAGCPSPNIIDPDLPASLRSLTVRVYPPGTGPHTSRRMQITANYTLP